MATNTMDIYPVSNGYSTAYLVIDNNRAMLVDASTRTIATEGAGQARRGRR